jgi:hypothetical protein
MFLRFYGTCFVFGLFALPLSGAGLTFFAAAKKVSKESSGEFNRSTQHLCSNVGLEVERE